VIVFFKDDIRKIVDVDEEKAPLNSYLAQQTDSSRVADKWGTHYVSSLVYGASLQINFHFRHSNSKSLSEIKAKLSGGINLVLFTVTLSGQVDVGNATSSSRISTNFEIYKRGGTRESMNFNPTSFTQVLELMRMFKPTEDERSLKVVGYRIKPLPYHRISALRSINPYELLVLRNNVARAAKLLSELYRIQARAIGQRLKLSEDKSIFYEKHLKPQFEKAADNIIKVAENAIDSVNAYLASSPYKIIANFRQEEIGWGIEQETNLCNELEGICGKGVIEIKMGGVTPGWFEGYTIEGKAYYTGKFVPSVPGDRTSYSGMWLNNMRHDPSTRTIMLYPDGTTYIGSWYEDKPTAFFG